VRCFNWAGIYSASRESLFLLSFFLTWAGRADLLYSSTLDLAVRGPCDISQEKTIHHKWRMRIDKVVSTLRELRAVELIFFLCRL